MTEEPQYNGSNFDLSYHHSHTMHNVPASSSYIVGQSGIALYYTMYVLLTCMLVRRASNAH